MAYSYNPSGAWTSQHQMSVNGKWDGFDIDDLVLFASVGGIKKKKALQIVHEVITAVMAWGWFAGEAGVADEVSSVIGNTFRLDILK